jgi:hypothetical protein
MRYYNLVITNPSGQVFTPNNAGGFSLGSGPSTFTSFVNGQTDPNALNVEFDLPVYPYATPQGGSIIRVWGIGLQMIGQASNLNLSNFVLSGGMQKGLPLANAAQSGVIAQGIVYQAFGNWQGVNQTLDLICQAGKLQPAGKITFNWEQGQTLNDALTSTLSQAFPSYTSNFNFSSSLQVPNDQTQCGVYDSLDQFAQYIQGLTQPLGATATGNASYPGVQFSVVGNTINAYDQVTSPPPVVNLAFQDLIGQPTFISPTEITFKTVLRADITIGGQVMFPQGVIAPYAQTAPNAAVPGAPARSKSVFQGTFFVTEMHHYGNFRQADADSWNTTFVAVPTNANV